jgi:hypothetical protein
MPLALTSIWRENIEIRTPSILVTGTMVTGILVTGTMSMGTMSTGTMVTGTMSTGTRPTTITMSRTTRSTFPASRAKIVFFLGSERPEFPRQLSTAG